MKEMLSISNRRKLKSEYNKALALLATIENLESEFNRVYDRVLITYHAITGAIQFENSSTTVRTGSEKAEMLQHRIDSYAKAESELEKVVKKLKWICLALFILKSIDTSAFNQVVHHYVLKKRVCLDNYEFELIEMRVRYIRLCNHKSELETYWINNIDGLIEIYELIINAWIENRKASIPIKESEKAISIE